MLSLASALAGNLTTIGSVANLIGREATKSEVHISFVEYLRVVLRITFLTLLAGIARLS